MTRFPVDGTGRLSSEVEHPTAALTGPAGGDLSGSYPNPTVTTWGGQSKATVVAGNLPGSVVSGVSGSPSDTQVPVADSTQTAKWRWGWLPTRNVEASNGVDDTAAINAAISSLPSRGGTVALKGGELYLTSSSLLLPQTMTGISRPLLAIEGNGAAIEPISTQTTPVITHTFPADQSATGSMVQRKFVIRNLYVDASNASNAGHWVPGVQIACSENTHIEDVFCRSCSVGFELTFCLGAQVNNCESNGCNTYGFVAQSGYGLWTGADRANSGSNQTKFQSCRDYALNGMTAQFFISVSDGVAVDNCTAEGGSPVQAVLWDAGIAGTASTVVKSFFLRDLHSENNPSATGAILTLNAVGRMVIDGIFAQGHTCPLIDASGSYAPQTLIEVRSLPFIQPGIALFKKSANSERWFFNLPGQAADLDVTDTTKWVGAVTPTNLFFIRNDSVNNGLIFGAKAGTYIEVIPGGGVHIGDKLVNDNAANEATSASAGANGAVPAQVKGYLIAQDHTGTNIKIPYFAN